MFGQSSLHSLDLGCNAVVFYIVSCFFSLSRDFFKSVSVIFKSDILFTFIVTSSRVLKFHPGAIIFIQT